MSKRTFLITTKELVPLLLIVIMLIFALGFWRAPCLPNKMPIHWNIKGQVDHYASKDFVFLFYPGLTLAVYLLMLFLPLLDPLRRNYQRFALSYYFVRLFFVGFLIALYFYTIFYSLGYHQIDVQTFIIPLTSLLFLGLGLILPKIKQNYFIGFRAPWTLQSERVWDKTHKFAEKVFIVMAVACFSTLFLAEYAFFAFIGIVVLGALAPVIYSYFVYRNLGLFGPNNTKT